MVAAGSGDYTRRGYLPGEEIGECAARFERTCVLQRFQLETQTADVEIEISAIDVDDRRSANVRGEKAIGGADLIGRNHHEGLFQSRRDVFCIDSRFVS